MPITLTDSIADIQRNINDAISKHINTKLRTGHTQFLSRINNLIPSWISSQPEIISLQSRGVESLIGQFGIDQDTLSIISSIIISVTSSTAVSFTPYDNNLNGSFTLSCQPNNFANLLMLPTGHVNYKDGDLHWMDWLLTRGDMIIVSGYEYNPQTGLGRSGLGNMIRGTSFRVPPEFAGVASNNFITRALSGPLVEQEISQIFKDILG